MLPKIKRPEVKKDELVSVLTSDGKLFDGFVTKVKNDYCWVTKSKDDVNPFKFSLYQVIKLN
jgi:hypothetical protein